MSEQAQKKIVYVVTKANFGGAQKYVYDMASHTQALPGFDPLVVMGANEFNSEPVFKNKLAALGVRSIDIENLKRNIGLGAERRSFVSLYKIFKAERPSIVHLNSPKAAGLGAVAARALGIKKIIYTVHGLSFFEDRPTWQKLIIKALTWGTSILCTDVIAISHKEYDVLSNWWGLGKKTTLTHNGVDHFELQERGIAQGNLAESHGIDFENKLVIGSIAELTKNKGLTYLLDALSDPRLEKYDWVFINAGTGELQQSLEAYAKELGIEKQIHLLGFVSDARTYLQAFDIFVLPSVKEGLPFCILESGIAALPTLATNVGGISEIINDQKNGRLVESKNSKQIADGLVELLENKQLRTTYGQALHQTVTEQFSLTEMCKKTCALYND